MDRDPSSSTSSWSNLSPLGSSSAAAGVRLQVIAGVCVVRLVLSPLFGIALVWLGVRVGAIVADDPVLLLVLLIESAMPTAMNLQLLTDVIAAGRGGDASRSMARMLAAQYLASVFSICLAAPFFENFRIANASFTR
jgi:predicted permease